MIFKRWKKEDISEKGFNPGRDPGVRSWISGGLVNPMTRMSP
jgi:hypothetical protein